MGNANKKPMGNRTDERAVVNTAEYVNEHDVSSDCENKEASDAMVNAACDTSNNCVVNEEKPTCKRPIDLITTECTFNESNIEQHDSDDINDNYDNAAYDESTVHLRVSSDEETSPEEKLSNVEESYIIRAIKKSKVCFIEENLAWLHDDQQYNREMVQVLKESSPVKKKCFENPVMVQSLTEHVPINTSQGNCEY